MMLWMLWVVLSVQWRERLTRIRMVVVDVDRSSRVRRLLVCWIWCGCSRIRLGGLVRQGRRRTLGYVLAMRRERYTLLERCGIVVLRLMGEMRGVLLNRHDRCGRRWARGWRGGSCIVIFSFYRTTRLLPLPTPLSRRMDGGPVCRGEGPCV